MQKKNAALFLSAFLVTSLGVACSSTTSDSSDGRGGAGGEDSNGSGGTNAGTGGNVTGGTGSVSEAPGEWLGEDPHIALVGIVGGKAIDFSLEGTEAADIGYLYCERNYVVPDTEDPSTFGDGTLEKVEVKYNLLYDGKVAEFQLEIEHDDLASQVGETFTVGEDTGSVPQLTLNPDEADEEQFEDPAVSGSIKLELFEGEPGEDGVVIPDGEGKIGFYLDLVLESGAKLKGSFTAKCGENDLETP